MPSDSDHLSTREAAERLGVAVRTIQLWVESGVLRAWKTAGGHRRIPRESVDELLSERRRAVAAAIPDRPASDVLRILVVEDDPALRLLFEMTLASWNLPLTVDLAENGFTALLKIGENPPDLLITDLNMPGMDGFAMIRHLRQNEIGPGPIPIVVVSALGEREIAVRGGLPAEVPRFGKPVPFDQLRRLIETRIGPRSRETTGAA